LPADKVFVFDACAVIALLDNEPGATVVEALLADENNRCLIHLLNVCEVFYHVFRRADQERAGKLSDILETYGFVLADSLGPTLWQEAGKLKAVWRRVSLVDCFAVALTIEQEGTLVTSDHHELDPLAEAKVCPFRFIR
jgi:uncharacterized protein with PIN domain